MFEIHKFARKPFHVEAALVTEQNMAEIAVWCKSKIQTTNKDNDGAEIPGQPYIKVAVYRPLSERLTKAFVGDWVVLADKSFKVYTAKTFEKSFESLGETVVTEAQGSPFDQYYLPGGAMDRGVGEVVTASVVVPDPAPVVPVPPHIAQ